MCLYSKEYSLSFGMWLTVITVVVLIVSLACVLKLKSDRALFLAGSFLILFGLLASSLSYFFVELIFMKGGSEVNSFRIALLSNTYLIIAAIGANLFTTAISSKPESERKRFSLFRS
jgi:hypothetical protein